MICICCKQKVEYLMPESGATNLNDACDIVITGYYGSRYDSVVLSGFICDDCIDELVNTKTIRVKEIK